MGFLSYNHNMLYLCLFSCLFHQILAEIDVLTIITGSVEYLPEESSIERQKQYQYAMPNEITPPQPDKVAEMARFIVHYSSWGSLSHISRQSQIFGSPLARVYSMSDGPITASSGIPYFYLTPNDPELQDMFTDRRASLTLTLAQTPYCRAKAYDPEDPRCAQIILTGKLVILKNSTAEWQEAQKALFSRHPVMKTWPDSHHWICCKLEIERILVADNFGGNKYPSVADYFRAYPHICSHDNPFLDVAFY